MNSAVLWVLFYLSVCPLEWKFTVFSTLHVQNVINSLSHAKSRLSHSFSWCMSDYPEQAQSATEFTNRRCLNVKCPIYYIAHWGIDMDRVDMWNVLICKTRGCLIFDFFSLMNGAALRNQTKCRQYNQTQKRCGSHRTQQKCCNSLTVYCTEIS